MSGALVDGVVRAVVEAEGVDPDRMDLGLRRRVGCKALDHLAARGPVVWALSFDLRGHAVTVTGSGVVLVDGTRRAVRT